MAVEVLDVVGLTPFFEYVDTGNNIDYELRITYSYTPGEEIKGFGSGYDPPPFGWIWTDAPDGEQDQLVVDFYDARWDRYDVAPQPIEKPSTGGPLGSSNTGLSATYEREVRDGIKIRDNEGKLFSTGRVRPTIVEQDGAATNGTWVNAEAAKVRGEGAEARNDGVTGAGGYCTPLKAYGFLFDIPPGAIIKGIIVWVNRRRRY